MKTVIVKMIQSRSKRLQLNYLLNFYCLKIINRLIIIIIEMNLSKNIIIGLKKLKNMKKKLQNLMIFRQKE